jgi:hypothetical protein
MKLIALPAFTDDRTWMLHDGRSAILVIRHHADPVGNIDARRPPRRGLVHGRRRGPIDWKNDFR